LTFQEVTTGGQIAVNWTNLAANQTGVFGETLLGSNSELIVGAQILLDSTSDVSLVSGSNGLTYSGANTSLEQLMLHEIGHALGFGDNANSTSIENYFLGSGNQALSAMDLAAAKQLYPH